MMNRINCQLNKIPIAKKIVILYGSLFTLTIIAISAVLLITAKGMGVGITITALQNCSETIESYVLSGKNITKESIETIIGSSYADYIIENKTEGEVYLNVNAYGDDIETDMPINRDELPENIEEEFDFHKKEADSGYIRIPLEMRRR